MGTFVNGRSLLGSIDSGNTFTYRIMAWRCEPQIKTDCCILRSALWGIAHDLFIHSTSWFLQIYCALVDSIQSKTFKLSLQTAAKSRSTVQFQLLILKLTNLVPDAFPYVLYYRLMIGWVCRPVAWLPKRVVHNTSK